MAKRKQSQKKKRKNKTNKRKKAHYFNSHRRICKTHVHTHPQSLTQRAGFSGCGVFVCVCVSAMRNARGNDEHFARARAPPRALPTIRVVDKTHARRFCGLNWFSRIIARDALLCELWGFRLLSLFICYIVFFFCGFSQFFNVQWNS